MERAAEPMAPGTGPLRSNECAGWWARLGAALLDFLILSFAQFLLIGAYYLYWWSTAADGFDLAWQAFGAGGDSGVYVFWIPALIYFVTRAAWEVGWLRSRRMAKPGQWICGFRVVGVADAQRIGSGRSIGRFASKLALNSIVGGIYPLVCAFTIGLSSRRQALHDLIAGTACVTRSALRVRGIGPDALDDSLLPLAMQPPSGSAGYPPPPPPPPGTPPPGSMPGSSPSTGPFV